MSQIRADSDETGIVVLEKPIQYRGKPVIWNEEFKVSVSPISFIDAQRCNFSFFVIFNFAQQSCCEILLRILLRNPRDKMGVIKLMHVVA